MKNVHHITLGIGVVILTLLISAYKISAESICQEPASFTRTIGILPNENTQSKPDSSWSTETKPHDPARYASRSQEDKKESLIQDQSTLPKRIAEWIPFDCTNAPQENQQSDETYSSEDHGSPSGYSAPP
jgi:hypothetical protein